MSLGKLFGTDGVRGVLNKELTPSLALKLGMAIASHYGEGVRVLVGRDGRAGGEMIMNAVIAGLLSGGAEVYKAGVEGYAPTPAIQYAVKERGYDVGVIVTASHNPPEYNGIKVISSLGIEIDRETEKRIEQIYFEERFRLTPWTRVRDKVRIDDEVLGTYIRGVIEKVDKNLIRSRGFRVLVDCANNVASLTTPEILRILGVKAYTLACNISTQPYREPEPTPSSLKEAANVVKALGLDLGVGHDGDGDRAIFIDEKGEVWWGDRTGALLSRYIAEHKLTQNVPRVIYTAVSSSRLVEEYLRETGVEVRWTPVGSINIAYSLLENGGIAGFEENGGFLYPPHLLARDGGMTLALFLEMLAREKKTASELFNELPRYYAVKTKIPMPRDKALEVVKALINEYKSRGARVVTVDGIRVDEEDYWFLVRPSGTEPVLRIMVEAKTPEKARQLAEELAEKARRLGTA